MFAIGEFSRITGLTIKALRFYHEQDLLVPAHVEPQSGYRYYDTKQIETARLIARLRELEFPLSEIKQLLQDATDETRLLEAIERHKRVLEGKIRQFKKAVRSLKEFIAQERQAIAMAEATYQVVEKTLEPTLIAGIRMKGRYSDCGKAFGRLGRGFGRYISGKPLLLHYDNEYKEDDADFEAAMPISRGKSIDGVSCRQIPGGLCVCLIHRGPYEQLGNSYAKILQHVKQHGYEIIMPTRELYLKGPGMFFKGDPRNYLTEIQFLIGAAAGKLS